MSWTSNSRNTRKDSPDAKTTSYPLSLMQHDIYMQKMYTCTKLDATRNEEAFLNAITGEMGAKDANVVVINSYEVLIGLRYVFADPNQPNIKRVLS